MEANLLNMISQAISSGAVPALSQNLGESESAVHNGFGAVEVTGYTDKTGDGAANQELAKNRALTVKAALEAAGVGADRVDSKPPVFVEVGAGGADAEARRVEISPR